MQLKNKLFIITGSICIIFIAVTSFKVIRYPLFNFTIITILFFLLSFWLLHYLLIKRIHKLNQYLSRINVNDLPSPMLTKGKDEISTIATSVNKIIEKNRIAQKQWEQQMVQVNQDLQDKNKLLQNEIVERVWIEKKLTNNNSYVNQLNHYDEFTSLPNRFVFNEILNKAINHVKRRKKILAVLLVDLDNFKKINMTLGYDKSNEVLKIISQRFSHLLRSEDVIAKLEGDEFIILLNDIEKAKFASIVAQKILQICSQPIEIASKEIVVTASIGICIYPYDGNSLESLLESADLALHQAKHVGGNTYQFSTQEMHNEAKEYIELETALRHAISNNELVLYYQPKLYLKKGTITGVEALLRWEHPQFGLIPPEKFLPIAEETGLITQIGEWVLHEACKTNKFWQDEGYTHLTVSVNLSPKQFHHPDLAKIITKILNDTKLNPHYLELEITEKIAMEDADEAEKILENLKKTDVQISIDHFGVGYTAISYLKKFPIHTLKIDPSFIKGIPHNANDLAIINAFIALAHHLGLSIVAEGVETSEQVQYLADQQCDAIQGYFISHPLPAQKIVLQFKKLMEEVLI